jgi:RNA polymerase sigma factor (sigma-70 family)
VFIIGKCLGDELDIPSGWRWDTNAGDELLGRILPLAYSQFGQSPIDALPPELPGLPDAPAGWDAYDVLAELMSVDLGPQVILSTRRRFRSAGVPVSYPELHDLSAMFANVHLRAALNGFDPSRGEGHEAAWMSTVFYRYALRHVMANRRLEDILPLSDELADAAADPLAVLEQRCIEAVGHELPAVLDRIPQKQREALALYFGFDGRQHTIAEVAAALSTNVYFARAALVSALGAVAASTGAAGLFTGRELETARSVFLDQCTIAQVAELQSTSQANIRRELAQISGKLKSFLRRRTGIPRTTHEQIHRESTMKISKMATFSTEIEVTSADASDELGLFAYKAASVRRVDHPGQRSAMTRELRRWLEERQHLLNKLTDSDESLLADLYAMQPDEVDRKDLADGHMAWQRALDFAAAQTVENMQPLLQAGQKLARENDIAIERASDDVMLARLRDAMAAVATALEGALPRRHRRHRELRLAVHFTPPADQASARWMAGGWESDDVALHTLARHRLGFVSGFRSAEADVFARAALRCLRDRSAPVLPGYHFADRARDARDVLLLKWEAPSAVALEDDEPELEQRQAG